jgi:hypothetical protein
MGFILKIPAARSTGLVTPAKLNSCHSGFSPYRWTRILGKIVVITILVRFPCRFYYHEKI